MRANNLAREGERGISPRALAAATRDEAPGPGAERKTWVAGEAAGGARSPRGAAISPRGRALPTSYEERKAAIVDAAKKLLGGSYGTTAILTPSAVARALGIENNIPLLTEIKDVLMAEPLSDEWELVRVERTDHYVRFVYRRTLYRCPLCGKRVRRSARAAHALTHIERLERRGILKLSREGGGWAVYYNGRKYIGVGWRTLCALAERLAKEGVVNSG
jgi:hypothetical protein